MYDPSVLDPAVDFLADLAAGGRIAEFAIGTGRVALPLAARGLEVAGIEFSAPMIDELRRKDGGADLEIVIGDMATTRLPGEFAVVFLAYNAITCLLTQEAQLRCFENAAAHLAPGERWSWRSSSRHYAGSSPARPTSPSTSRTTTSASTSSTP
ncbi:bifunctional 2-polyprenyl-6-hydroxyphenol methylase/3-demethylubiquinol 3-O-methyltransferase UbiG [Curtobacterium sp. MCBD17_019]|uniref:class I SAM-dependent methyltransferase n=1 Tax=Curtobacterium sp. MCBD17_019 TaxID=2175669 RepID=UPI0021AC3EFC|nr:class I SAM-dependent methyltransferase [Curtobacterium sp. MCBD17_019]